MYHHPDLALALAHDRHAVLERRARTDRLTHTGRARRGWMPRPARRVGSPPPVAMAAPATIDACAA